MNSQTDNWNGVIAIATSLTVIVALGVPLIIWWLTKPKVKILKISPIGWFFAYKDGKIADRAIMTIRTKLQNSGNESTTLEGKFITSIGEWELTTNGTLEGHGTIGEVDLMLETKSLPKPGQPVKGKLILTPWGNRRLLMGKKKLICEFDVPENQTGQVISIKKGEGTMGSKGANIETKTEDKSINKIGNDQSNKVFELLAPILLLPTIVLTGYLTAFLHEIGYASRFGIPIDLIRIDATTMMTALPPVFELVFFLLISSTILAIVNWVNSKLQAHNKPSTIRILLFWSWFDTIVTTSFIYSGFRGFLGNQSVYIACGLLILELVPLGISELIYNKRSGNALNKELDQNIPKFWKFYTKPSVLLFLISFGLFTLCLLAWVGGTTDALSIKSYLEPTTPTKSVVIRIYGDEVICAPINEQLQIEHTYFILKLDDPGLNLTFHQYNKPFPVATITTETLTPVPATTVSP